MISAKDIREFTAYLRNCTDQQVRGVYEKEKKAGRDEYVALAEAEAETARPFLPRLKPRRSLTMKRLILAAALAVAVTGGAYASPNEGPEGDLSAAELEAMVAKDQHRLDDLWNACRWSTGRKRAHACAGVDKLAKDLDARGFCTYGRGIIGIQVGASETGEKLCKPFAD